MNQTLNDDLQKANLPDNRTALRDKLLGLGHSKREADYLSGLIGDKDLQSSRMEPLSDGFVTVFKPHATAMHESQQKMRDKEASIEKNPIIAHSVAAKDAMANVMLDYNNAKKNLENSEEYKNDTRVGQRRRSREFEINWHNSDHKQKIIGTLSNIADHHAQASAQIKENQQTAIKDLITGGHVGSDVDAPTVQFPVGEPEPSSESAPSSVSNPGLSTRGTLESIGGQQEDSEGSEGHSGVSIAATPMASFARRNPKLVEKLRADQADRLQRIDSARMARGTSPKPTGDAVPVKSPQNTIIRRPKKVDE